MPVEPTAMAGAAEGGLRLGALLTLDPWIILACVLPALVIGATWRSRRAGPAATGRRAPRRVAPAAQPEPGPAPAAPAAGDGVLLPCRWQRAAQSARQETLVGWRCRVCGAAGFTSDGAPPGDCRRRRGRAAPPA